LNFFLSGLIDKYTKKMDEKRNGKLRNEGDEENE
jgi:hypothetical protein